MIGIRSKQKSVGPSPGHGLNTLLMLSAIVAGVVVLLILVMQPGGGRDAWQWSPTFTTTIASVVVLGGLWLCLFVVFRPIVARRKIHYGPDPPYNANEYAAVGLGRMADDEESAQLYIDLVKRCVVNILYEDQPMMFFDDIGKPKLAREFDLQRRVAAEEVPTQAHTMIGIRALDNIQQCIEAVIDKDIPGDLAETGSFRGGATIFMRAVLKAHRISDRQVFVCDAFVPPEPDLPPWPLLPLLQALASIPGRANKRRIYRILERMPQRHRAFPLCENPSDKWIEFVLWSLRHPEVLLCGDPTSRAHVESRFARYGLLDEQVIILEGFFADTLPEAPIEKLALLRLDCDTYESTRDAIEHLYPKLSPGGYCIIDDFHAYAECERAVAEYRQKHNIQETIQVINRPAVFWQKKMTQSFRIKAGSQFARIS